SRRIVPCVVAAALWTLAEPLSTVCAAALRSVQSAPSVSRGEDLPSRFTDKAYWQLIGDLSETGGSFRSDNFLSNENEFQTVIPELRTTLPQGGVYVGVGPEQNFTYIVALR